MIDAGPTVTAYSFAVFLSGAYLIDSTTKPSAHAFAHATGGPERSFKGSSFGPPASLVPEAGLRTTLPDEGLVIVGPTRVEDALVREVLSFRDLLDGWDGEQAVRPTADAIADAVHFLYAAGSRAAQLEPTLHVDGSVILEIGDGAEGSFRFKGNRQVICAIQGMRPQTLAFDRAFLPDEVEAVLVH